MINLLLNSKQTIDFIVLQDDGVVANHVFYAYNMVIYI